MNFLDADYSAIEARIVNWLAGQEDALAEYRAGVDRYKRMASVIYGVPENEVTKFPMRFIGKQTVLGCSYQMGPVKFRKTCEKFGYKDLPPGLEEKAVKAFRLRHKKIVAYWDDVQTAACQAVLNRGRRFLVRNVQFLHARVEGMPFLLIKLPSGRKLAYPKPRFTNGGLVFFGHLIGANWGDVSTYGGKLVENIVQGIAADIMANGAHNAEQEGYQIATLIHDQALAYKREGQTPERFVQLLTQLPDWAKGLPLEAEGAEVPFYKKD